MLEVPLLLLYGAAVANVHDGAAVWAQTRALLPGLLVGLMWAVTLAAISLLLASLTGRRGFATGAVAIALLLTYTLSQILLQVETITGRAASAGAPLAEKISGLFSPFTLFDGVRMWLGATDTGDGVPKPGAFGAVYAVVLIVVVGLCLAGLGARYRKAHLS
jgi:ABC-2 type transport system permease protein